MQALLRARGGAQRTHAIHSGHGRSAFSINDAQLHFILQVRVMNSDATRRLLQRFVRSSLWTAGRVLAKYPIGQFTKRETKQNFIRPKSLRT